MPHITPEKSSRATKDCPMCGEEILEVAVVCKHCGSDLRLAGAQHAAAASPPYWEAPPPGFAVIQAIRDSMSLTGSRFGILLGAQLLMLLVLIGLYYTTNSLYWQAPGLWLLLRLVVVWAPVFMEAGLEHIRLKVVDGQPASVGDLFSQSNKFFRFLFTSLSVAIIVGLGSLVLVIPGIIALLSLSFAPLAVIDRDLGAGDALRYSAQITRGVRLKLLGYFVLIDLINLAGALLFGLGLLFTVPFAGIAWAYAYRRLSAQR